MQNPATKIRHLLLIGYLPRVVEFMPLAQVLVFAISRVMAAETRTRVVRNREQLIVGRVLVCGKTAVNTRTQMFDYDVINKDAI